MTTETSSPPKSGSTAQASSSPNNTNPAVSKKRYAVSTHKTNTFAPLCRVKFVYADNTNEPVRNRHVAYWVYDSDGKKIDTSPQPLPSWAGQGLPFPVGIGATDENGYLLVNTTYNGRFSVKDPDGKFSITSICDHDSHKTDNSSVLALPLQGAFPLGKKAGFILCPVDMLDTLITGDLTKFTEAHGAAIVDVSTDEQVIKLKCTLSDWEFRIKTATAKLKNDNEKYSKFIQRHLEAISQIELLSSITNCMSKFPGREISYSEYKSVCNLSGQLNELKDIIGKNYIKNTATNSECGKLLNNIDKSAKKLIEIIENSEFIKEYEKYFPLLDDKKCKGHFFEVESDWRSIFETLKSAYAELSNTNNAEKVFNEHVLPFIVKIAHYGVEGKPEWTDPPAEALKKKDTPLLTTIDKYTTIIQSMINPAPGPVSLIEGIVDAFGMLISRWMNDLPRVQVKLPRDVLYGVMRVFNKGQQLSFSEKGVLAKAVYAGRLSDGRKALYDFSKQYLLKSYGESAAKLFCRTMFLFALISFYNTIGNDEKDTWKKRLGLISSGSNAAATLAQTCLAKYLDEEIAFGVKVGTAVGSFAAIGCIAAAIISVEDSIEAFSLHENTRGYLLAASAFGSILLSAGFFMMTFGAGTFWVGGLGIIFSAIGAILTVGTAITLLIIDLIEEGTSQAFKQIIEDFSKEESTYGTIYCKESIAGSIKTSIDKIRLSIADLNWWDLSWRAIVPLYSSGFKQYKGDHGVSYIETAKILSKMIYRDSLLRNDKAYYRSDYSKEGKIVEYLYEFLQTQKNQSDFDNDGIPDAVEWVRGTIYPQRQPFIYDPNPKWRAG
jgi:hypothetical protein